MNAIEIPFTPSEPLTLGAEIEVQLIDKHTLDLCPAANEILRLWDNRNAKLKPELFQSMLEINTGIGKTAHDLKKDLKDTIKQLNEIAASLNVSIATAGTHPTAKYREGKLFEAQRYKSLIDRNQWIARRLMIFGLHLHVGVRDGDHCVRLMNQLQHYTPHFLALSASSPYFQGEDTGLASARILAFETSPTGGHPFQFSTWNEFVSIIQKLVHSRSIQSLKDIWWDLRPSPTYGTLEIRICDGLTNLQETVALIAYMHSMVIYIERLGDAAVTAPPLDWIVRENKWRVSRHGMEADIIINEQGDSRPIRTEISEFLDKFKEIEMELDYQSYFKTLRQILKDGASYDRQRRILSKKGSIRDVVQHLMDEFTAGKPLYD